MSEKRDADKSSSPFWADYPDEELLSIRLCDLGVEVEGGILVEAIDQLYHELEQRGIAFRPHFWISDDWFTPDGVPGVAVPFYLTHPRLMELERSQMLDVEGGTREWCMKYLRHETGHAIDNAYVLRKRRKRKRRFGKSSQPYPEYYTPKPYSQSYVVNLKSWYAQSHPDEDFAETFAVWLDAESGWAKKYANWPAIKKLQYMDELMMAIRSQKPPVTNRRQVAPLSVFRKSLREHYRGKREIYQVEFPDNYDRDLRRLFRCTPDCVDNPPAAAFLARIRKDVRRSVARRTGLYQYTIDQVLEEMIQRSRQLDLRLCMPEEEAKFEFAILLTVHTMDYLHSGRFRLAL